jgi:tripartite-type tricarboxylate transporter receptor subunit TctC
MKPKTALFAGLLLWAFGAMAFAQSAPTNPPYPTKPLKVVLGFPAGGTSDKIGRIVSNKLSENIGQPVVVENKTGANGIIGTDFVAKSAPDGYTLLMVPSGHAINNSLSNTVPYDPVKDFETLTLVGTVPMVAVVNDARMPIKDIAGLIAKAKADPGKIVFGSGGPGSSNQLAVELFSTMAGIKMTHIPYRGDTPGITDLLGGQIDMIFLNIPAALGILNSGKVHAIGITGKARSSLLPNVPTIAETVPGYEAGSWHGFFVPAKTPKPIVSYLNAELVKAINSPQVKPVLLADGVDVVANSPEEFAAFLNVEIEKWAKIIKTATVKLQ